MVILLYTASKPAIATLGRLPGPHGHFVDLHRNPDAQAIEGLVILRLDTPLYYFNATTVGDRVLRAVDDAAAPPRAVLLDIEATIELDVTTSDALYGLIAALEERGTRLVIVHAKGAVRDRMRKVGLIARLGSSGLYPSERVAVDALAATWQREAVVDDIATAVREAGADPSTPSPIDSEA